MSKYQELLDSRRSKCYIEERFLDCAPRKHRAKKKARASLGMTAMPRVRCGDRQDARNLAPFRREDMQNEEWPPKRARFERSMLLVG